MPQVVLLYSVAITKPPISCLLNIAPRNSVLRRNSAFSSASDSCASVHSKGHVPFEQTYLPGLLQGWHTTGVLILMSASPSRLKLPAKMTFQCKSFFSFPEELGVILLGYKISPLGVPRGGICWNGDATWPKSPTSREATQSPSQSPGPRLLKQGHPPQPGMGYEWKAENVFSSPPGIWVNSCWVKKPRCCPSQLMAARASRPTVPEAEQAPQAGTAHRALLGRSLPAALWTRDGHRAHPLPTP